MSDIDNENLLWKKFGISQEFMNIFAKEIEEEKIDGKEICKWDPKFLLRKEDFENFYLAMTFLTSMVNQDTGTIQNPELNQVLSTLIKVVHRMLLMLPLMHNEIHHLQTTGFISDLFGKGLTQATSEDSVR